MDTRTREVWERIAKYPLDESGAVDRFAERLARENNWSIEYANRVTAEYKRFVALCVLADHPVTPSEDVDQAWHLHLCNTKHYWEHFCPEALGRPLHHHPSRGGSSEARKHLEQYEQSLASYRQIFGSEPPSDIWPDAAIRFGGASRYQRVDTADSVVMDRATVHFWNTAATFGTAVAIGVAWGLGLNSEPLEMMGPTFLGFYALGATVIFLLAARLRTLLREPDDHLTGPAEHLDAYEVAYLAGGPGGVARSALAKLTADGRIRVETGRLHTADDLTAGLGPIDSHTLQTVQSDGYGRRVASQLPIESIHERLTSLGFLTTTSVKWAAAVLPLLIAASVPILGTMKLIVGISRHKPVGFLIVLLAVSILITLIGFIRSPFRTRRGDRALGFLRERNQGLRLGGNLTGDQAAFGVGLFGVDVLTTGPLADLRKTMGPQCDGSYSSIGGCGSSTGGAGGDGGGGGGGGCGGGGGGCGGCGGG